MTIKLDMVRFFKENYNIGLNYKLVKTMDPMHLEMSYQMALLDKRFHLASLSIASAYRGIRTRRALTNLLGKRKAAILMV